MNYQIKFMKLVPIPVKLTLNVLFLLFMAFLIIAILSIVLSQCRRFRDTKHLHLHSEIGSFTLVSSKNRA